MPHSGVTVPDDLVKAHEEMKLRKKKRCNIYVIDRSKMEFKMYASIDKIDNQNEQVESIVHGEISTLLGMGGKVQKPTGTPCYVIWDLKLPGKGGQDSDILVFMGICLDDMDVKERLLFASSLSCLKDKMSGIGKVVSVKNWSDMESYASFLDTLK